LNKLRILVVEDEEDISELIRYNLVGAGFAAVVAGTGEQALRLVGNERFDLILLDLMLPGIGGIEVARILKTDPKTQRLPVVMLTARSEEFDVVSGLELSDDYITKPFSPKILIARIRSVLRRYGESVRKDVIHRGDISIDQGKRKVEASGVPVELSYSEFQILTILSRRPGWVFTRSQIVDAVRGDSYAVTERSVDVQIAGLRKKLGPCGHYIETVRSVGYRFMEIE
jgi:two-component system phosphate regulon response regulator PhoB